MKIKPMLATKAPDLDKLRYPVLASPKLDGIRCLTPNGEAVSRNGKPIANDYIRNMLESLTELADLDGELVTLDVLGNVKPFNEVSGDVMRKSGTPDFEFLVFDCFQDMGASFASRLERAQYVCQGYECVKVVPHVVCKDAAELQKFEQYCVDHGYEGVMTRDPEGKYKQGRSTAREQGLLKVKRFADAEGKIVGFAEQMENTNAKDENGKRGQAQAGLVPKNTLGALVLETQWGVMEVGSGFNEEMRRNIWLYPEKYMGQIITFTYQPSGMKDKPRFPVFKGFRDLRDM